MSSGGSQPRAGCSRCAWFARGLVAAIALFGCASHAGAPNRDGLTDAGRIVLDAVSSSSMASTSHGGACDAMTDAMGDAHDATAGPHDATSGRQDAVTLPHDAAAEADSAATDARDSGRDAAVDALTRPTLLSLTVSPLTLYPAFSPTTFDYYVRCAAGDNELTVSVTAPPGGTASITQPVASNAAVDVTVTLDVVQDEAIVASVSQGAATRDYWIRCLPPNFPVLDFQRHTGVGTAPPGYYLLGNLYFTAGERAYALVLDGNGVPVWYGMAALGYGAKVLQVLDLKTISYIAQTGYTFGTYAGSWELHALDPVGTTYVTSVGMPLNSHDMQRLSNGDFLLLAVPVVTGVDLSAVAGFTADENILDCVIQEVSPDGGLVWQWRGSDHMSAVKEGMRFTHDEDVATTLDGGTATVVDPFHCNSLDVDGSGNILLSARDMNAIVLVSRSTGKVLWKLGGTTYSKDGAPHITIVGDSNGGFYGQHDARLLADGTISVFDDETFTAHPSRGLVVSYDVDAGTASIVWQYVGGSQVSSMGSVTVLSDGSHVIGWGATSHAFTETNEQGADLVDLWFADGDETYRAVKVPLSALDLDTLRRSIGPWSGAERVADAGSLPDGG